jgi:hypothetical protein
MPVIAKETQSARSYTPPPPGTHRARCVQVIDLGTQRVQFNGSPAKMVRKVRLAWELSDEHSPSGRRYTVAKHYTCSLHEKAALRQDLQAWRSRAFTQDELNAFDLSKLLNVPALLTIVHEARGEDTFAAVRAISQIPKSLEIPPAAQASLVDYSISDGINAVFTSLPDRIRDTIKASAEWSAAQNKPVVDDDVPF